jgi:hypothetical protein
MTCTRWASPRYYAYTIHQDGTEDHQAFHDMASRDEWVNAAPMRFPEQRRDMSKPEIYKALWWTDTLIGA